ncbi:MAG: DUF2079 domain-containing protein [Nitrososphaerota archaeon]
MAKLDKWRKLVNLPGQRAASLETSAETSAGVSSPQVDGSGILARWRWLRSLGRILIEPYRPLPPAPRGRWTRIAFLLTILLALAFVVYFTAYTWSLFDAFLANAEDMGIMDQALWNTLHGAILHQTICNSISDTNCLGDISRFAIHFEPIMLPFSLLYALAPSPKTLLLFQTLVVATGAYPVFWMACRRLASPLAGLIFAAGYLLYPALQGAVMFDFHAVTLTMPLLLFAFYFALTRNNIGLVIACVLALATKEEVPLDVLMLGLAIFAFQRRTKVGLGLIGLSLAWLAMALAVMHLFSPVGHSPLASRYSYLGGNPVEAALYLATHPVEILRDYMLANGGFEYLNRLLGAFSFLGLASPLTLILGVPALMINLLSGTQSMHTGAHQYSAEIVPVMVFSAISSLAVLLSLAAWLQPLWAPVRSQLGPRMKRFGGGARLRLKAASAPVLSHGLLGVLLLLTFYGILVQQRMVRVEHPPQIMVYAWPVVTAHSNLANTVTARIPPGASVSAQDVLVPHLSQRRYIYQYPYRVYQADYVVLDTTGYIYPFTDQDEYDASVRELLNSGQFDTDFDQDGYLILRRIH